jgi:hypothetical protein
VLSGWAGWLFEVLAVITFVGGAGTVFVITDTATPLVSPAWTAQLVLPACAHSDVVLRGATTVYLYASLTFVVARAISAGQGPTVGSVVFLFAISLPWVAAPCISLKKGEPKAVLVPLLIAELAAATVRIVIGAVLRCRERTRDTSLKATQADVERRQQNEDSPEEAEQLRPDAAKAEPEEEGGEEERNEPDRKRRVAAEEARKKNQAKEAARKALRERQLNWTLLAIAAILIWISLATQPPRPTRPTGSTVQPASVSLTAPSAEHSQMESAPAGRETNTPPTASPRHRGNVTTPKGDVEVPQNKTRRPQRHQESETDGGVTEQPRSARKPQRHSKGQPTSTPEVSPSRRIRKARQRSRKTQESYRKASSK